MTLILISASAFAHGCGKGTSAAKTPSATATAALLKALEKKDLAAAGRALEAGADVNARDWTGGTVLHIAVLGKDHAMADLLLANGANVDARNRSNETPLHLAAQNLDADLARLLLVNGANSNAFANFSSGPFKDQIESREGLTALHIACAARRTPRHLDEASEARLSAEEDEKRVLMAKLLLEHHAAVNVRDPSDHTPVWFAVEGKFPRLLDLLVSRGGDVNTLDSRGKTPLDFAVLQPTDDTIVKILRSHGAKETEIPPGGRLRPNPGGDPTNSSAIRKDVPGRK